MLLDPSRRLSRSGVSSTSYSEALRSRNALEITETELKLMAALAIMGLSSKPKTG